jgi:hypothetical protein
MSNLYADSGFILRGDKGMANGMPVAPRLELRRWLLSTSSMLRMGEATEPGLCVRCCRDGLSARRPGARGLPSRRATTSFISWSSAASRDAMARLCGVMYSM